VLIQHREDNWGAAVNKRQWWSQWELRLSSPNPFGQRGSSRPTPPFGERPHPVVDWI